MLTATQFWTKERREELRKWNERPTIGGGWRPANLRRVKDGDNSGGAPVKKGPHEGFRLHERWPDSLIVEEARSKTSKRCEHILDHNGWFTDSFQDGMIYACAVQVRVPRRRAKVEGVEHADSCYEGHTRVRWMEATAHTEWDQILISRRSSDLHETLKECIRSADRVAEMAAEEAREEDMKDQAEQQINEKREEVEESKSLIRECITEIKFMRKHCQGLSTAYEVLRERICSELAEIRKARKRIALLEREPWQAVSW